MNIPQFRKLVSVHSSLFGRALTALAMSLIVSPALADLTDISNDPMSSAKTVLAKPNIMLLMDTSGSMGWGHMPDEVESVTKLTSVGYKNSSCNVLYYNPSTTYELPMKADGTRWPTPSFTAAPYDVFNSASTEVTNLSTAYRAWVGTRASGRTTRTQMAADDPAQAAYYYSYSGAQTLKYSNAPCTDPDVDPSKTSNDVNSADYDPYRTRVGTATSFSANGGGTWTRVLVGAAEQQNFANWYTYYRTRMALTKSAMSLAFSSLSDNMRVGFITMFPKTLPTDTSIDSTRYLAISDFNVVQRNAWFNKLFSQTPYGSSPAREGLARVGRHYAGKQDGINAGMTGDPVQYACQKNYTIMTTDGYWNDQAETPGKGPVGLDGTTLVGQQDGTLTDASLVLTDPGSKNSPRPIWEGFAADSDILTTKTNSYSYAPCNGSYFSNTSTLIKRSTRQITAATSQQTQYTTQDTKSTTQVNQTVSYATKSQSQWQLATAQNQSTTYQTALVQSGWQFQRPQIRTVTTQLQKRVTQEVKITTTLTKTVSQLSKTTQVVSKTGYQTTRTSSSQTSQTTTGVQRTTSQPQQTTTQMFRSTTQNLQATSRVVASTSQVSRMTTQIQRCDATTELCTYVASCSPSGTISCNTLTSGPTLVTSCTNQTAAAGNNYTTITCTTNTLSSTGTVTCTPQAASAANNYTTTDCSNTNTAPTPVATCTPATASSSNNYTATTCSVVNTGPTAVQTCTAAAATSSNSYTATTCNPTVTGPTGVSSCSGLTYSATSSNGWISSTCSTVTTSAVYVDPATCPVPGGIAPTAGNGYMTTTCTTVNTPSTYVQPTTGTSGNCPGGINGTGVDSSFRTVTCSTSTTSNTVVDPATCTSVISGKDYTNCAGTVAASSGNGWLSQTFTTSVSSSATATDPVACPNGTVIAATLANGWTTSKCAYSTNSTNWVDPSVAGSCTAQTASSTNGWTKITCTPTNTVTTPSSCTASSPTSSNSYTWTQCSSSVGWVAVAPGTCSAGTGVVCGWGPLNGTPNPTPTAATPGTAPSWVNVTSCTGVAQAAVAPDYVRIECQANAVTTTPSATCTSVAVNASGVATTCSTVYWNWAGSASSGTASWTYNPTCTTVAASSTNSYIATNCNFNTEATVYVSTSGLATGSGLTCTTLTPGSIKSCSGTIAATGTTPAKAYTTTQLTPWTPISSCSTGNTGSPNWVYTYCQTISTSSYVQVGDPTCVSVPAGSGNAWTASTCTKTASTTEYASLALCNASSPGPQTGTAGNNWLQVSCAGSLTGPTPVQSNATNCPGGATGTATVSGTRTYTCSTTTVPAFGVAPGSCTNATASAANSWTNTTCNTVRTPGTGGTAVATCTPVSAAADNNWVQTVCPVVTTPATGVASCTDATSSSTNNYTSTTCGLVQTGPTPVATCTAEAASLSNNYTTITCDVQTSTTPLTQTCVPQAPSAANGFVAVTCTYASANKIVYSTTTTTKTTNKSGGVVVGTPTIITYPPEAPVDLKNPSDSSGQCYTLGVDTIPTIPLTPVAAGAAGLAPSGNIGGIVPGPELPNGCTSWADGCLTSVVNSGGSVNSLADVAQYYYINDLRPDFANRVESTATGAEDDRAYWQHMTTFAIALGVSGTLNYQSDYKTAVTGDFADIRSGVRNWPLWPDPALTYTDKEQWNNSKSIDDFWHAAVNGRGRYFSAGKPAEVVDGLLNTFAALKGQQSGASSAAATSSLQPVAGDNYAYVASYTKEWSEKNLSWFGDINSYELDLGGGFVSTTAVWSAAAKLNAKVRDNCDTRTIYLFRAGATKNRTTFSSGSVNCDTGTVSTGLNADEMAYFGSSAIQQLSQYPLMTDGTSGTVNQRTLAAGSALVNYLRGQSGASTGSFTPNNANRLFRFRGLDASSNPSVDPKNNPLGDIVNAQPTYVRKAVGNYSDAGYSSFITTVSTRTPMVYVAANDGMLHAFYAGTSNVDTQGGVEAWSFIPTAVLPRIAALADDNYKANHQFMTDGTPVVGDVKDSSDGNWKTILVAGLNQGGKAYYALDVTDPTDPKGLWEFKWSSTCYDPNNDTTAYADCHLGSSFSRPVVTKLGDGRWVVMFSSGYNNVNAPPQTGDGQGYLYVLDAITGKILYKLSTGAGDATTPSNLGQISNFVDDASTDNRTVAVYAGDMLGNVWRFDVNGNIGAAGQDVMLLGVAKTASGTRQPITTRVELSLLNNRPFVMVATGRLLGYTDLTDTTQQSVYGFRDDFASSSGYADLRASLKPMIITTDGDKGTAGVKRTVSCDKSDATKTLLCGSVDGWVIDLPESGERVNVDMRLFLGTLVFGSNIPSKDECLIGGYSYLNYVDFKSGNAVETSDKALVTSFIANSFVVGVTLVQLPSGKTEGIVTKSDATSPSTFLIPIVTPPPKGQRISWREITQ